jgi:hypothetical protein
VSQKLVVCCAMQRVMIGTLMWGFRFADTGRHPRRRIRRRAYPLAQQVQDQNRLDIVIYEEDYLTRALLREWLGQAAYRPPSPRPQHHRSAARACAGVQTASRAAAILGWSPAAADSLRVA